MGVQDPSDAEVSQGVGELKKNVVMYNMSKSCNKWTRISNLGPTASKIDFNSDCTKRITCKNGKTTLWKSDEEIDVNWCEPPKPVDCSPSTAGEYYCDKIIPSGRNVGDPVSMATWQECRDWCGRDSSCQAWTFSPGKQCQKKKKVEYVQNSQYISGPRPGVFIPTPPVIAASASAPKSESTGWLTQQSSLGVQNWVVLASVVLCLLLVGCGGIILVSASRGNGY